MMSREIRWTPSSAPSRLLVTSPSIDRWRELIYLTFCGLSLMHRQFKRPGIIQIPLNVYTKSQKKKNGMRITFKASSRIKLALHTSGGNIWPCFVLLLQDGREPISLKGSPKERTRHQIDLWSSVSTIVRGAARYTRTVRIQVTCHHLSFSPFFPFRPVHL